MIFDQSNLPSRTIPYPVKQIEVDTFKPKQLALMSKAVMLDDYQPVVEAMGQVLHNLDIAQLTVGDFFYLLTWQRVTSLKKNPVMAKWECPGSMFADRDTGQRYSPRDVTIMVDNWKNADEEARKELRDPEAIMLDGYVCSHVNYKQVTMDEFPIKYLEEDTVLDQRLDYPRCGTLAEFVNLQRDPDYGTLAESGQWLKGRGTLLHRIQQMVEGEDTDLLETALEHNRDITHGIVRTISKGCEICKHQHAMTMVVDPRSFFL